MKIYFAGSIRGGRNDKKLYGKIIKILGCHGTVLTEHLGNNALSSLGEDRPPNNIYERDIKWLREADLVIAEVTTPSLGVGYEIAKAEEWGKRILCIYREINGKRISAMVAGSDNLTIKIYKTLDDVKKIVDGFINNQ